MRTLLSVNSYYYRRDGSEAVFFEHNRLFEEAGLQVVPFAMRHPENQSSAWDDHFVSDIEFGHDYSLLQKLARVPKVIYSVEARDKLGRLLDQVRPGIAHLHTIYHHLSPSILDALKRRGIPTLMTLHDLKIACPAYHMMTDGLPCERCRGGRLHNVVVHRCIKDSLALSLVVMAEAVVHALRRSYDQGVDLFVAPSRFYIDKLEEWGWPRSRFVHVPNCVPVDGVAPAFEPGNDFLYFGRLAVEKGLITLVRAAARAGVRLRMAGQGPLRATLEQEATSSGANIEFLGQLSLEALRRAIATSRATVLASECYENAPMSVLESYAMGKPVIGSRIGGIPEIIRECETGWLFRTGSVEDLADITSDDAIANAVTQVRQIVGDAGLYAIVNCAGSTASGPMESCTREELLRLFDVNAAGPLAVVRAVLPLLRKGHGRIVNIGSTSGQIPGSFNGAYCGTKFALDAMHDVLRAELAASGVAVSLIVPGVITTPFWKKAGASQSQARERLLSTGVDHYEAAFERRQRVVEALSSSGLPPESVAEVVVEALSASNPRSRYVVGQDARWKLALWRILPGLLRERVIKRGL